VSAALILAHAGHWFAGLLYLAPVLIVVGALMYQSWKDKRLGEDDDEREGEGDTPPDASAL
jgi:hypothetical protein